MAFDLVGSTLMASDPAGRHRFNEVDRWRSLARAMPAADVRTFEGLGQHGTINLIGLALECPGPRTATDLVAYMAALPPEEVVRNAIGRYRRTILRGIGADVIDAAVGGDEAARKRFMTASWADVPLWQKALRHLLGAPADEVGLAIVSAFRHWNELVFAHEEARLAEAQEREVAALRAESASWSVDSLLRRVAPTLEYVPPSGIELVTVAPISSVRPIVLFLDHRMETIVLFATSDQPAAGAPPEQLVLLGKALGDELRLRTLRALAAGPRTLGELAVELGVPRTSLSYHIGILRAAGLIRHTIEDGRWGRLTLRPDAVARVEPLFRGFLADNVTSRPEG
jgi:DNA-binding transcriptional ArsR family regulator